MEYHLSHAMILEGPDPEANLALAKKLAQQAVCTAGGRRPCGVCRDCVKAAGGSHPDIAVYGGKGGSRSFHVEEVRQIRDSAAVMPNEAQAKVYILDGADHMTEQAQNALLKVLEEPPSYVIFLLTCGAASSLLPTVRSRCTELNMQALPEDVLRSHLRREFPQAQEEDITAAIDRSGGFLGQAMSLLSGGGELPQQTRDFVQAFSARDALGLMQTLTPMEKWKRDALADTLEGWRELLESALASRSGIRAVSPLSRKLAQSRSSPELLNAVQCLQKAVDYTTGNVSPAAVCGWLEWALR